MEHAHVLSEGDTVQLEALPAGLHKHGCSPIVQTKTLTLDEIERQAIIRTLKQTGHSKAAAARILGVNYQRFNRLIKRLNITSI